MFKWFARNKDIGILLLRFFIGIRLLYGVQDNILHWKHMKEFEAFLTQFHFPLPLVSAIVSVYAQAIAGLLVITGFKIRWTSLVMILNFIVAVLMVHWGQSFEQMTTVLFMIFTFILFLFIGAGKYSLDRK